MVGYDVVPRIKPRSFATPAELSSVEVFAPRSSILEV